jgi:hypothetical protein
MPTSFTPSAAEGLACCVVCVGDAPACADAGAAALSAPLSADPQAASTPTVRQQASVGLMRDTPSACHAPAERRRSQSAEPAPIQAKRERIDRAARPVALNAGGAR